MDVDRKMMNILLFLLKYNCINCGKYDNWMDVQLSNGMKRKQNEMFKIKIVFWNF